VGVSRNLPPHPSSSNHYGFLWNVGIVGVNPSAIFSESLDLSGFGGLDGVVGGTLSETPYWLQDDIDGKCLGPTGSFVECGDATLWKLVRRSEGDGGYALQILYGDIYDHSSSQSFVSESTIPLNDKRNLWQRITGKNKYHQEDCLIPTSTQSTKKQRSKIKNAGHPKSGEIENEEDMSQAPMQLGSCSSPSAWRWHMDERGVLSQIPSVNDGSLKKEGRGMARLVLKAITGRAMSKNSEGKEGPTATLSSAIEGNSEQHQQGAMENSLCLWRELESIEATLAPCQGDVTTIAGDKQKQQAQRRLVGFSLVRCQTAPANRNTLDANVPDGVSSSPKVLFSSPTPVEVDGIAIAPDVSDDPPQMQHAIEQEAEEISTPGVRDDNEIHLPHSMTISQPRGALHHKPPLIPLTTLETASILRESHPTLILSGDTRSRSHREKKLQHRQPINLSSSVVLPAAGTSKHQTTNSGDTVRKLHKKIHIDAKTPLPSSGSTQISAPRRIHTHPYIEASKNGIWDDPETGLKYPTDLHAYLGHQRKESGRHTLVGVGQYTRTMLKIKVYGVAFYVSKRQVLSNPAFAPFAHLEADQLKTREDFYTLLMNKPSSGNAFDRSLFIKLNMQLSTDTMRSSLEADWKLLTEEHKAMLISSSFKPRPAEERMLALIKSEENSSNCSCGQFAPEEYKADPSCCARGTELVFTWRKNGDLEVRLDGRTMDSFPQPDLASGIFYEYLRFDDPISPAARENFSDGFPFLLAPLAQVRGVSSFAGNDVGAGEEAATTSGTNFYWEYVNAVSNQAVHTISRVQDEVGGTLSRVASASRAFGDNVKNASEEINRQRLQSVNFVLTKIPFLPEKWRGDSNRRSTDENDQQSRNEWASTNSRNRCYRNLLDDGISCRSALRGHFNAQQNIDEENPYMFSGGRLSDEIGVTIRPTVNFTHRLFFATVHLYLMLLLIVSLPGSHSTRLVVRHTHNIQGARSDEEDYCFPKSPERKRPGGLEVSVQLTLGKDTTSLRREGARHNTQSLSNEPELPKMKKSLSYYV